MKSRFSATFNFKFATAFSFDTFAEKSQVSPARMGELHSIGAPGFLLSAAFGEPAGEPGEAGDLDGAAVPFGGAVTVGASTPGAVTDDARETSLRSCTTKATAPPTNTTTNTAADVFRALILYA
jgi:hypothetical protein